MRVASKTIYESVSYTLNNSINQLNNAFEKVSSGKRLTKLSSDSVGLSQALGLKSNMSNLEQMGKGIDMGGSWLNAAEQSLSQVEELLANAKTLALQMSTATASASGRAASAQLVQSMLEEVVALANMDVSGRYIFAGSQTDSQAFTLEADNSVTYNGDANPFTIRISRTANVSIGYDGSTLFQTAGYDLFQTLDDFRNALLSDDTSSIQSAITELGKEYDFIIAKISDVGSKVGRLESKKGIYEDLNISYIDRLSKVEDVDLGGAAMELKAKEMAYQAALSSASTVLNMSLMDYL